MAQTHLVSWIFSFRSCGGGKVLETFGIHATNCDHFKNERWLAGDATSFILPNKDRQSDDADDESYPKNKFSPIVLAFGIFVGCRPITSHLCPKPGSISFSSYLGRGD